MEFPLMEQGNLCIQTVEPQRQSGPKTKPSCRAPTKGPPGFAASPVSTEWSICYAKFQVTSIFAHLDSNRRRSIEKPGMGCLCGAKRMVHPARQGVTHDLPTRYLHCGVDGDVLGLLQRTHHEVQGG
ncbi:hypothetical protein VTN02DRAFT_3539 [Thermoascus thermophilus]